MKIYKRNIQAKLEEAIKYSPIIFIKGPRQSGKTTLIQELKGYHFATFDNTQTLRLAADDPMGFIQNLPKPVIIDEVQRCPELFLAIKYDIDRNRIPGRYVLTGSADPMLMAKIGDSLAGRVKVLTLYPLSYGELQGIQESFVDRIWSDGSLINLQCQKIDLEKLYTSMVSGGYPVIQNMPLNLQREWFHDYTSMVIQKDILELAMIEHIKEIPQILSFCAARAGSLVNVSELSRDAKITVPTLQKYLSLLEVLFIVIIQSAWQKKMSQRLIKAPKSYLVDTGLLCWLRMVTVEKMMHNFTHEKGYIVENFVVNELMKQITWNTNFVKMYHFRSANNQEVDIILERIDGKIIGIEVKSNQNVSPQDIKGMKYLKDQVPDLWHRGILFYCGNEVIQLTEDIIALPISALWSI